MVVFWEIAVRADSWRRHFARSLFQPTHGAGILRDRCSSRLMAQALYKYIAFISSCLHVKANFHDRIFSWNILSCLHVKRHEDVTRIHTVSQFPLLLRGIMKIHIEKICTWSAGFTSDVDCTWRNTERLQRNRNHKTRATSTKRKPQTYDRNTRTFQT